MSTLRHLSRGKKLVLASIGAATGASLGVIVALNESVKAAGFDLHPAKFPWDHNGPFSALDHASVRRGYEVYKQVCATCHSMKYVAYRNLVNVTHTDAEARAEAEAVQVKDGPDEEGNSFTRPGKLSDYFPNPYPNEEAARYANDGAYPPDLSYIVNARHGGEDYIFSLLTGYCDPPAGIQVREGLHYNPYFAGGLIGMAKALDNEIIEYEDGTPATQSQLAKDVVTFLKWAAEPEHDDRKRMALKVLIVGAIMLPIVIYGKRFYWSVMKTRKIAYQPRHK